MSEEPQGCTHRERKDGPPCNKVCDPDETLCPHHKLLHGIPGKRKPPAAEDGQRRFRTPKGYDV